MDGLLSPQRLKRDVEAFAAGRFLAKPHDLLARSVSLLRPPERISTVECAERYRYLRNARGDGKRLWSRKLTPYLVGPMDALDDSRCNEVVMPKPGRSGGTVAFENYAFKLMRFGPMGDILWYLGGPDEVKNYADKQFKFLFEDHPEVAAKIGEGKSDDNLKSKRIAGRTFDILAASPKTITNRQALFIMADEIDTFTKAMAMSFLEQTRIRGRMLGSQRKVGITSHPDLGWVTGVAQAWTLTSRGIFVMQCSNCGLHGSPYPTKYWPDVPRFRIDYERYPEGERARTSAADRAKLAERTAAMRCPHCHTGLDDKQRFAMIDEGLWMHDGQRLDIEAGIIGEPDDGPARGFWIHGLMVKAVSNAELARDLESAVAHYDSTKKTDKLKQVVAKVFGEVFEGAGDAAGLDGAELKRRAREMRRETGGYEVGSCPREVMFIVQTIDVGHRKFDIGVWGFDEEGRSWMLDRITVRQRMHGDGVMRDIRAAERVEDWSVLEPYIDRLYPIVGSDNLAKPVAVTLIDSGDGNVTWKAYEFARRMANRKWGTWPRVKLIKGATTATAPELPLRPTEISKDDRGRPVRPTISLFSLGVSRLKELAVERLATQDGGPGQCYFARGLATSAFDEFFGERQVGGKWERSGPNESLDLFGYAEAGRLLLKPEREDINWTDTAKMPVWARPVPLESEGGDPEADQASPAPEKKQSIYARMDGRNRMKGRG